MFSRRIRGWLAPALCLTVLTTAAGESAAAGRVQMPVPQQALGWVVINRLQQTDAKLTEFCRAIELPFPGVLRSLKSRAGLGQGLDASGSAAVALLPGAHEKAFPRAVLLLPVSDYGQFIGQPEIDVTSAGISTMQLAGAEMVVGHDHGYAVVAKKANRQLLEEILNSPTDHGPDLDGWSEWLGESDAAVVVTGRGVKALCQVAQQGLGMVSRGLEAKQDQQEQLSEEQARKMDAAIAVFRLYEKIPRLVAQQVGAYAAAVTIDADGSFRLSERIRLKPEGRTLGLLREVKSPKADLLAGLPAQPIVAVMAGVLSEPISEVMIDLSVGIMRAAPGLYGLSDQQMDRMAEISRESMRGMRGMSWMIGPGEPGDSIYGKMMAVITVDDAEAFLAHYKKTLQAMSQLAEEAKGSMFGPMDFQDVALGRRQGLKVSMTFPDNPMLGGGPEYDRMMESLFGPGKKITFYLAPTGKNTVALSYVTDALLRESIEVFDGTRPGLSADAGLAQTARMLPQGAPWVGYLSPKGTVDFVKQLVALAPIGSKAAPAIPDFPATPPVGVAIQVAPEGLHAFAVVPGVTARAIGRYVVQHLVRRGPPEDAR